MKFIIYFENDFIGKINKHNFLKLVVGGQKLELLYWTLSPIYQQEYVRGGVNVWKCSKALVRGGYHPRT